MGKVLTHLFGAFISAFSIWGLYESSKTVEQQLIKTNKSVMGEGGDDGDWQEIIDSNRMEGRLASMKKFAKSDRDFLWISEIKKACKKSLNVRK